MDDCTNYDFLFKILLIGDSNVGKTSIFQKYLTNTFTQDTTSTVGVEFSTKTIVINQNGKNISTKLQIWDTAGQERYRTMTQAYYRGAAGALLVYDITNYESFAQLENWINEVRERSTINTIIIAVGNKQDLEDKRKVPTVEGQNLCKLRKCLFLETSAFTGNNIQEAFNCLVSEIVQQKQARDTTSKKDEFHLQSTDVIEPDSHEIIQPHLINKKNKKGCC